MSRDLAAGPRYNGFTLVQGCLLTRKVCPLPSLCIHPVGVRGQHDRLIDAVNGWLRDLNYSATIEPSALSLERSPTLSLAVVDYVTSGPTIEDARRVARWYVDFVLDVMSLHRGAVGTPILTVLEPIETDEPPLIVPETPPYKGNLLGGVISGEDPDAIGSDVRNAAGDRLLQLWLSSASDAIAEPDHDFARVRWWNLLETMAQARHRPSGDPLFDSDGKPIANAKGKPVTDANSPSGRVYAYVRDQLEKHQMAIENYVVPTPWSDDPPNSMSATLYTTIRCWYGMRNAVAHHGKFDEADSGQQQRDWFPYVKAAEAYEIRLGRVVYLERLRELVTHLVRWEIAAAR